MWPHYSSLLTVVFIIKSKKKKPQKFLKIFYLFHEASEVISVDINKNLNPHNLKNGPNRNHFTTYYSTSLPTNLLSISSWKTQLFIMILNQKGLSYFIKIINTSREQLELFNERYSEHHVHRLFVLELVSKFPEMKSAIIKKR